MSKLTKRDFDRMNAELAGRPIPTNADYRRAWWHEARYWLFFLVVFVLAGFVLRALVAAWT